MLARHAERRSFFFYLREGFGGKEGLREVRMKLLCFHSNFIYRVHIPKH